MTSNDSSMRIPKGKTLEKTGDVSDVVGSFHLLIPNRSAMEWFCSISFHLFWSFYHRFMVKIPLFFPFLWGVHEMIAVQIFNQHNFCASLALTARSARFEDGDLLVDHGHHHHETNGQQNQTLAHQHLPKATARDGTPKSVRKNRPHDIDL